ncbi:MAG: D-alanine--D-alanine ligase [Zetaproteobacteria bacterium]|nr:MAG: D-alanine--D-alanine ligase [Zetaproteobacteria bacterium]
MRVGVLMGGVSSEREISLRSGRAVLAALQRCGVDAVAVEIGHDWLADIGRVRMDRAFLALHGTYGEDGCVQGLLEIMGIPYTGAGVTASAVCMNKRLCKDLLAQHGLRTPVDIPLGAAGPVRYPVVVKPVAEGSSVGLHFVRSPDDWQALDIARAQDWLIEMPVEGTEVAVGVLNGDALPPVEVAPHGGVYDFEAKYTPGSTDYFCPARLPAETLRRCMEVAEQAVRITGCKGAPRVDMIVADGGEPVVLEINTIPGMTETSLLPKAAARAGIDFDQLCLRIMNAAQLEHGGKR